MDPLESLNFQTDSTLLLMKEAHKRGYKIFFYTPENLSFCEGILLAQGYNIHFEGGALNASVQKETFDLAKTNVIFIRQNPPFDMGYLSTTYLLDLLPKSIVFVNHPAGVRNSPEKILVTHFPDLIPPTLISRDPEVIQDFIKKYQRIVLKPLYSFGGQGIFTLQAEDPNLAPLLETFLNQSREPFVIQKFLPEVFEGDVRILLIDGEPVGGFRRVPKKGDFRSNLVVGGTAEAYTLSPRDKEICKKIAPILKERGLIFVGIDVIGGFLTEINTTSPAGLGPLNEIGGHKVEAHLWNIIEKKHRQNQTH
ncbi:MAG: glutathione synthase [bacterium]|nr:glutathione synthase [bacterium]